MKRSDALAERGLDFADAESVFAGNRFTRIDSRRDYGEPRYVTAGYLDGRWVITWTPRDGRQRIISMRYGHGQEEERYRARMDRSR